MKKEKGILKQNKLDEIARKVSNILKREKITTFEVFVILEIIKLNTYGHYFISR